MTYAFAPIRIPVGPKNPKERIKGQRYIIRGSHIRIWSGRCWNCAHNLKLDRCKQCTSSFSLLKDSHPELRKEWCENNVLLFDKANSSSNKKASWKCKEGHVFIHSIRNRTCQKSTCPECRRGGNKGMYVVLPRAPNLLDWLTPASDAIDTIGASKEISESEEDGSLENEALQVDDSDDEYVEENQQLIYASRGRSENEALQVDVSDEDEVEEDNLSIDESTETSESEEDESMDNKSPQVDDSDDDEVEEGEESIEDHRQSITVTDAPGSSTNLSIAPKKAADRVVGQRYLKEGQVCIWAGNSKWKCQHNKSTYRCKICVSSRALFHERQLLPPLIAPKKSERVKWQRYTMEGGTIRSWSGTQWFCEHHKHIHKCDTCTSSRSLLKDTHPHLRTEWCDNNVISFDQANTYGVKEASWRCKKGHLFTQMICTRTRVKNECPMCFRISKRKHDGDEKARKIASHVSSTVRLERGDASEIYVEVLMRDSKQYAKVTRIGMTGDKTDVVTELLLSGIEKSVQVKTMWLGSATRDSWHFASEGEKYDPQMLIVAVNPDRNRFAVDFAKNMGAKSMSVCFGDSNKHAHMLSKTPEGCLKRIHELIPFAVDMKVSVTPEQAKEMASLGRLESTCVQRNLVWGDRTTNSNSIDAWIQQHPVQCKYVSFPLKRSEHGEDKFSFHITCRKSAGRLNGSGIFQPYQKSDLFTFMIVELGGTYEEPDKYKGQFWIAPKSVLIERGIIATGSTPGQCNFYIMGPDYARDHWSLQYWNQFSLLNTPVENESTVVICKDDEEERSSKKARH
jgi:hypothetical protein